MRGANLADKADEGQDGDDVIRAPAQRRSRDTMERVLTALEELLREKPFDAITINELAAKSGTAVSSIYARFKDKNALILGLHQNLQEMTLECIGELANPERWDDRSRQEILPVVLTRVVQTYRQHAPIIRAAALADIAYVYERMTSVWLATQKAFTDLLAPKMPAVPRRDVGEAVEASVRIVTAVMHQMVIFNQLEVVRHPVSDRQLVRQLCTAVAAQLDAIEAQGDHAPG